MYGPELWPEQPTQNTTYLPCSEHRHVLSTSSTVCTIVSIVTTIMFIVAFHTDHLPESWSQFVWGFYPLEVLLTLGAEGAGVASKQLAVVSAPTNPSAKIVGIFGDCNDDCCAVCFPASQCSHETKNKLPISAVAEWHSPIRSGSVVELWTKVCEGLTVPDSWEGPWKRFHN